MLHFCFVGLALLVLTTASPLQPIVLPPSALTAALPPANSSAISLETNLKEPTVQCNGERYGYDLNLQSCRELVEHQLVSTGLETFAPRRSSPSVPAGRTASCPTPWLFSSADGKCSLEVFQTDKNQHTDDVAQIKLAAEVMFTRCVLNGGRQGAIAANLGHDERLGLIMRSYEPSVTCGERFSKTMPILKWVETMFRAFPASKIPRRFGPDILPWVMRTPAIPPGRRSLAIRVSSDGATETSSWYDIYAALTTVWTMCGARGRAGIATDIGEGGALSVEFKEFGSRVTSDVHRLMSRK